MNSTLWSPPLGGNVGIDRVDSSVRTNALNICVPPCRATCNFMKGSLPTAVLMAEILAFAAWRAGIESVDTSTFHTLSNHLQCHTGKTTSPALIIVSDSQCVCCAHVVARHG